MYENLQTDSTTQELDNLRARVSELESLESLYEKAAEDLRRLKGRRQELDDETARNESEPQTDRDRHIDAFNEISRIISASLDISEVYEKFASAVHTLVRFDRMSIGTFDSDIEFMEHRFVTGVAMPGFCAGDVIRVENSANAVMLRAGHGVLLGGDSSVQTGPAAESDNAALSSGLHSGIIVPLVYNEQILGSLVIRSNDAQSYSQKHLDIMERVSDQVSGAIANANLHSEVRREARERKALAEIGRIISSTMDINLVYERFVEQVRALIPSDRVVIGLIDAESYTKTHAYIWGTDIPGRSRGEVVDIDGSYVQEIVSTGQAVRIQFDDRSALSRERPAILPVFDAGLRSLISAPLVSNDQVIGVLHLCSTAVDIYTRKHVELANSVGLQIAGAIASSKLFEEQASTEIALRNSEEEQRQLAHENRAIAEIGRIITSALDIEEAYDFFAEQVRILIPFDRITIGIIDLEANTLTHSYIRGPDIDLRRKGDSIPLDGTIAHDMVKKRAGTIFTPDSRTEVEKRHPKLLPIYDAGLRSFLSAPLISNDKVIGVIHIRSFEPGMYDTRHLDLVERVAYQIAGAIANAQLNSALHQQVLERDILAEITQIINSSLEIEVVYERFAELAKQLIDFDRIAITIADNKDDTFSTSYAFGIGLQGRSENDRTPLAGTLTGRVMNKKAAVLVDLSDRQALSKFLPGLMPSRNASLRSTLAVPLISNDEVIGALVFESIAPNAYDDQDISIAERVGVRISSSIVNALLYADRSNVEEALRESVERFDLAVQGASEGLWDRTITPKDIVESHDPDAKAFYSPKFVEMLGYKEDDFPNIAISWESRIHPDDHARVIKCFDEHIHNQVPYDVDYRLQTRNGAYRWFNSIGQAVWDGRGVPIRMAGCLRDITERRLLEAQLLQSQKMEALGTLTGGIAHDFNNLLTAILGYTQLGMMTISPSERVAENLKEIEKAAERAAGLTRQLLTFSRSQVTTPKIISLNEMVLDIDNMLRRLIGEDVEMITLPGHQLGYVKIDPGQMEQVLINLVVNARDSMPLGGRIYVETQNEKIAADEAAHSADLTEGEYVSLTVRDTGSGISPDIIERVFEPFFSTKEPGKGTGLGLATCYGIVTQVGGHITVDSQPDEGSAFKIYLPVAEEVAGFLPMRDESGYLPSGTETILLVEDEPAVREVASHVLNDQGYRVLLAENGLEAIRIVEEMRDDHFDLLLTDVVMPLMGGRELAQKLRDMYPEVKVLYTSGYAGHSIGHHGMLSDGSDYMQKPFTPSVLARKVRQILDRPR